MDVQAILAKIKQYPIAVGGFVAIIVFAALIFLRSSRIPELEAKQKTLDQELSTIQRNETAAVGLPEHVEKIKEDSAEIKSRLMVREDKAISYQYFYELERSNNVALTRLAQSDAPPPAKAPPGKPNLSLYAPVEYSISVSGKFQNVLKFLYKLQHGKYFINVESFSCNSSGQVEPDTIQVSMKMDILGRK